MIKAKSSISGLEHMVFSNLYHMRLNEAYMQIRMKESFKEDEKEPNFTDPNSDDFIPLKQMFKESDQFSKVPLNKFLFVSILSITAITRFLIYLHPLTRLN